MLDLAAIERAPVACAPFTYLIAHGVLSAVDLAAAQADFPPIANVGLFPLAVLEYGTAFARLVDELRAAQFESLIGEKLGVDLSGRPIMVSVRGRCHKRDGRIHADSRSKIATCILYLNDIWDESGGRLRMLRSSSDIDDYVAEVPPDGGTLAAYVKTDTSWHGHKPYLGPRRYIMLNWMVSGSALEREVARHRFSAFVKGMSLGAP